MSNKTAIVIGAGILGLATARALALKGYRVKVFEKTPKASGASVRNFGMIWPIGQPSGKLYDRAVRTRNIWKEIAEDCGLWYDPVGSLHLAHHEDEWQVLQELFQNFSAEGRQVKLLEKHNIPSISPIANENNCHGGLYCDEEMIVDPREAISTIPLFLNEKFSVEFHWGKTVQSVKTGKIVAGKEIFFADQIFICSGADFETLYPEQFQNYPLTKCKLQMMRISEEQVRRIGPALCGGLSLIHYASFKTAPSLSILKSRYEDEMSEYLKWGIHVMISQTQHGELTVGDSHEYGLAPDPFDRIFINDLILKYLKDFASLKNPVIRETWNGVYGKFTDGQTELFFSPDPEVFILNGVGGTGMTLSFGFAEEKIASF